MEKQVTVTFKYLINQKVFVLFNNKAKQYPIHSMKCDVEKTGEEIMLYLNVGTVDNFEFFIVNEKHCYSTKQQLIDSL